MSEEIEPKTIEEAEIRLRENFEENQEVLIREFTDLAHDDRVFEKYDKLIELLMVNNHVHGFHINLAKQTEAFGEIDGVTNYLVMALFGINQEVSEVADTIKSQNQEWNKAIEEITDVILRAMAVSHLILAHAQANGQVSSAMTPGGYLAEKIRRNVDRPLLHGEKRF
jgi:hypothetical protein